MIAALYIDARGPYPKIGNWRAPASPTNPHVDCWDETRNARTYNGPHAVVAHPPCKHWGRLRHLAHVTCLGCEHSYSPHEHDFCPKCGDASSFSWSDKDCAPRAVEQVRKFGGVLEHPAGSKLWEACGLPLPLLHYKSPRDFTGYQTRQCECGLCGHDSSGGYTIELDQSEWGHVARKRTWLYLVGVPRSALEDPPYPGRKPTHYASGGRTKSSRNGGAVPVGMKVCSAQQRRRTPPLLAEYLVRLAQAAAEARKAA